MPIYANIYEKLEYFLYEWIYEGVEAMNRETKLVLSFTIPYLIIYMGMAVLFGGMKKLAGTPIVGGLTVGLLYALLMFPITWGFVVTYVILRNKMEG